MRNKIKYLIMFLMGSFVFISCEINDPIAEISKPGHFAANVYWDVPNTVVNAGSEVPFYGEYWSVDNKFEYLGVWYDVKRKLSYSLTYYGNGYTFSFDSTGVAREFQEIITFEHSQGFYNSEKKAYVINGTFPISYTLSGLEVKTPVTFNLNQFNQLFPQNIQKRFFDGLFPTLLYSDLRNLLVVNNQLIAEAEFETHFNVVVDPETQVSTKVMKTESATFLKGLVSQVPLAFIIYNSNRQFYAYTFTQGYELNAKLRVVNGNKIENFSDSKRITVL